MQGHASGSVMVTQELLGCYISGICCLPSAGYILIEGGAEPFVEAGDNSCQQRG